ncbi:hypothetical protein SteCoe_7651 [Stentor coeruleus]|uniref:dual-specificity kinase n=1 Tax=Stentor coeruleus TaxID=5963 RepID=A0A1R2CMA2_9CILI|nr:hypothetical protein SteCoe_7651 [Stentor coeruleus]
MQKAPKNTTIAVSNSPESPKKTKLILQTPKHKHTASLITPKVSSFKFKPMSTLTSKNKLSISKFLSPNAATLKLNTKHKHTFSEQIPSTVKNSKLIKRKPGISPDKKPTWKTMLMPLSNGTTLKLFSSSLNAYEQTEILSYSEIYYIGSGITKIKTTSLNNFGFDDEKGDYKILIGDHIVYRYEIKSFIGKGSFGQVVKAYDHKEKKEVALKIIKNRPRFYQQALEEVEILKYIKDKDPNDTYCVVHLQDNFVFRKHMVRFMQFILFEILSIDLYQYMKLTKFQGLPQQLIKKLAGQILQALRLIDRYKIIHCDLKPENILLKSITGTALKVIDFGSACFYEKRAYTYIQSRFYRAPEVILGLSYTTSIDMWSFGCILVELFTGRPIFPGENEFEQIQCIMEVLGLPPGQLLEKGSRVKLFFDEDNKPKITTNSKGKKRYPATRNLREILFGGEEGFVDLIEQCLEWDYHKRITPDEALLHEWMQDGEPVPAPKHRLKHQRTCSDTSFLKLPQRFDKLSSYIEGPSNLS